MQTFDRLIRQLALTLACIAVLHQFPVSVHAQETTSESQKPPIAQIEGAFGLKLGDPFDVTKAKRVPSHKIAMADNEYEFLPDKKVPPFTRYTVNVTPITHKIVAVNASVPWSSLKETDEQIAVLKTSLVKKYGAPSTENRLHYQTEIGERRIMFLSYGVPDGRAEGQLGITYYDRNLIDVADREREEAVKSEQASKQRELDSKAKGLEKSGL